MSVSALHTHSQNFANLKCESSTIICRDKTVILGEVTIGADCVIHPSVVIQAREGPIRIGKNNLIEERVRIINNRKEPLIIGSDNVFEVDSICEAVRVGNGNIMEAKSSVCSRIEITNNCIIGAGCKLESTYEHMKEFEDGNPEESSEQLEVLSPYTVISGKQLCRKVVTSLPKSSLDSQLDFLRKVLPNYQKLWRPGNLPLTPQQK